MTAKNNRSSLISDKYKNFVRNISNDSRPASDASNLT